MDHMKIFAFCLFYLLSLSILLGLIGLASFPPEAVHFTIPEITIADITIFPETAVSVSYSQFITFSFATLLFIIILINLLNTNFLGTGFNINTRQVSTVIVGLFVCALFGFTLQSMLPPETPVIVPLIFVYPFIILMMYSVIAGVGMKSGD